MTAVGLNLLWLVPGVVGGSEDSTVASLHALGDQAPDDVRYTLFARTDLAAAHPKVAAAFEVVDLALSGRRRVLRVAAESTWLAAQARRRRLGLVHHLGGTVPLVRTAPAIVTIHDLQPLDLPDNFSRVKVAYLRAMLPRAARAARLVIVPSGFVRDSVIARLGVAEDRVIVVPHAVELPACVSAADDLRQRYALGERWVVLPAITYPHKGHGVLLDAFAPIAAHDPDVTLVLTGGEGPSEPAVRARIDRSDLRGRVRRVARIPRADVDGLIAHAAVLAFPSRYEGFGLPAAEAMAAGCPVVASATTSLPEVVGDAGILLAPDDVAAWTNAIDGLLRDPAARDRLAALGRAQATRFSPAANGRALVAAHRRALG